MHRGVTSKLLYKRSVNFCMKDLDRKKNELHRNTQNQSVQFLFLFLIIKVLSIYTFFVRQKAYGTASLKSINSNINFIQKFMHNATVLVYFKICSLNIYNMVFPLEVKTKIMVFLGDRTT